MGEDKIMDNFLEELHSTLHVDAIEARGLHPRKGTLKLALILNDVYMLLVCCPSQ